MIIALLCSWKLYQIIISCKVGNPGVIMDAQEFVKTYNEKAFLFANYSYSQI